MLQQFSEHYLPSVYLWNDVSETAFCLHPQVKEQVLLLGPVDTASPYFDWAQPEDWDTSSSQRNVVLNKTQDYG